MKYLVLMAVCVSVIPTLAYLGYRWQWVRNWLLAAIVFSTCLGPRISIHVMQILGYRGTDRGIVVHGTDILVMAMLIILVVKFPRRLAWVPYNTLLMGAVFVWWMLSTVFADNPTLSVFTLWTMVRAYLLYWVVANALRAGVPMKYAFRGMIGIGIIVGMIAGKQMVVDHIYRVTAFFEHSNTIPSYCLLFIPAMLAWGICDRRRSTWESVGVTMALAGMSFAILYSLSRVGVVLLGASVFAMVAVALAMAPTRRVQALSGVVLGLCLFGFLAAGPALVRRFEEAPAASASARDEFNKVAAVMAESRVLGVGPNNFAHLLTIHASYRSNLDVLAVEEHGGVCHNIYLLTAAETGWAGLLLFMLVPARFYWLALSNALRRRRAESLILVGLVIGWTAMFSNNAMEWVLRQTPVMNMFMISAALAVSVSRELRQREAAEELAARHPIFDAPSYVRAVESARASAGYGVAADYACSDRPQPVATCSAHAEISRTGVKSRP